MPLTAGRGSSTGPSLEFLDPHFPTPVPSSASGLPRGPELSEPHVAAPPTSATVLSMCTRWEDNVVRPAEGSVGNGDVAIVEVVHPEDVTSPAQDLKGVSLTDDGASLDE